MTTSSELVSLEKLVEYCLDDRAHYQRYGTSINAYPLELFTRAISQGSQAAWICIWDLYSPLVRSWVGRLSPPEIRLDEQDCEALVNAAFAKFCQALTPIKLAAFPTPAKILAYLKCCVRSVVNDEVRFRPEISLEEAMDELVLNDQESEIISNMVTQDLRQIIQEELANEEDRWVFFLAIIEGLQPREICAKQPHRFPTADYVSQKKRSLLRRLANSRRIRDLLATETSQNHEKQTTTQIPSFAGLDKAEKGRRRIQAKHSGQDGPTYYQQIVYCGKPHCHKCQQGIGHGPYWYAYQIKNGRTICTYLGKEPLADKKNSSSTRTPEKSSEHRRRGSGDPPLREEGPKVTYRLQRSFCGKIRCHLCRDGVGHGPYWYAYRTTNGRTQRTYVGKTPPESISQQLRALGELKEGISIEDKETTFTGD